MKTFRILTPAMLLLSCLALHGCGETKTADMQRPGGRTDQVTAQPGGQPSGMPPVGSATSSAVTAAVLPLGSVPYDNFTLPLISPSGRHLATEAGVAPHWSTAIAAPDAEVSAATRVDVFQLDFEQTSDRRVPPTHTTSVADSVLLGRSCDAEGFLVERQNTDGSRWIGKADWLSGQVQWIVNDNAVNAFAALGRDGRLAWSRRRPGGRAFDLMVRSGGREWMIQSGDDWVFPVWSGKGDGLFLIRLASNGDMHVAHAMATDATAFRQSLQMLQVASGAGVSTAYEAMVAQSANPPAIEPQREELVFHHPTEECAAVWRPYFRRQASLLLFDEDTYTALLEGGNFALVTFENRLVRQNLFNERDRTNIIREMLVARSTARPDYTFLLLSPGEGRIGISALALLPIQR